jgi:hypothetical protein
MPQPRPKELLPLPVLYDKEISGWKPLRPGGKAIGTEKLPVPVNKSGENFSPKPFCAPPPLGVLITDVPDLLLIGKL